MINLEQVVDDLFKDINKVRTNPPAYAQALSRKESLYMGDLYRPQGKYIQTKEGVNALRDAAVETQRMRPLMPLTWSFALHVLADEEAIYIGTNGLNKGDRTLAQRVPKYALVNGRINEIIELGGTSSEEVLHELIVDDGLATRRRRRTLLDEKYRYIGIATAKHSIYGYATVILLAEQIQELLKPTKELVQLEVEKRNRKEIPTGQNYYKIKKAPPRNQVKHFKKSQVVVPPLQSIPLQVQTEIYEEQYFDIPSSAPPMQVPSHFPITQPSYSQTVVVEGALPPMMTSTHHSANGYAEGSPYMRPSGVQVIHDPRSSSEPGLIVTSAFDHSVPMEAIDPRGTLITAPEHMMMVDRLSRYRPPQLPPGENSPPGFFQRCSSSTCLLF